MNENYIIGVKNESPKENATNLAFRKIDGNTELPCLLFERKELEIEFIFNLQPLPKFRFLLENRLLTYLPAFDKLLLLI